MAAIVKLPSGRWRAQVRRNKKYVSRTHYNTKRPHSSLGYRPPAPLTIAPNPHPLDEASNMQ